PADPSSGAAAVTLPADDSVEVAVAGDGPSLELMEVGKSAYATCAACHGPDGKGLKAGPMLMAPSLVGSELLLGDPDAALLLTLKGIAKENMDYMGMMASLAAGLNDEKLAGVLTYTRNSWGNSAPEITVEQAAEARSKFADVDAPAGVKRADIQAIVDAHK
ncbi:MAG: cytochrome c, partial [Verrucomicrobiota bacterium]